MKKCIVFACLLGSFIQVSALKLCNIIKSTPIEFWMPKSNVELETENQDPSTLDPLQVENFRIKMRLIPKVMYQLDSLSGSSFFCINLKSSGQSLFFEKSFMFGPESFDVNGTYYIVICNGDPRPDDVLPDNVRIEQQAREHTTQEGGFRKCWEEPQYYPVLRPEAKQQ